MVIAIYTHSDYFDILQIQLDYFQRNLKDSPVKIYVFSNKVYDSCIYETLLYDDSLPYASRLLQCLEKIQCEYMLIIHDNDILLKYNQEIIDSCVFVMKEYTIDSLELKQFQYKTPLCELIILTETLFLNRKTQGFIYSVQPTIWKTSRFKQVLSQFPDKTYRNIECDEVNSYILENCKVYNLADSLYIQSIFYQVSEFFVFIHITFRNCLILCDKDNNLHETIQTEHENIYNTYLVKNTSRKFYSYEDSCLELPHFTKYS